jgi:hypothetical protein
VHWASGELLMNSSVFRYVTPCSLVKVNRHFREQIASIFRKKERVRQETSREACCKHSCYFAIRHVLTDLPFSFVLPRLTRRLIAEIARRRNISHWLNHGILVSIRALFHDVLWALQVPHHSTLRLSFTFYPGSGSSLSQLPSSTVSFQVI